ncbi:MAG: hypothetical protein M9958_10605 [Chitinophagales bacterium]|nr:hypothetical protein [Chitinophagales bacterium]
MGNRVITISDFSPHLFWDIDISKFDFHINKVQLVHKVLEYGKMKDWILIKELYGLEEIKVISLNLRTLDDVTLAFLSNLFQIDKTKFRCYKHKQSVPNLWNS